MSSTQSAHVIPLGDPAVCHVVASQASYSVERQDLCQSMFHAMSFSSHMFSPVECSHQADPRVQTGRGIDGSSGRGQASRMAWLGSGWPLSPSTRLGGRLLGLQGAMLCFALHLCPGQLPAEGLEPSPLRAARAPGATSGGETRVSASHRHI